MSAGVITDIGKLAAEAVELDLPVAAIHVLVERPAHQAIGEPGIEEQDSFA